MKKKIVILALVVMTSFSFCPKHHASEFIYSDIENHWAKDIVMEFTENQIVCGYEDGTFKPNNPVTVAEFLKMLMVSEDYKVIREGKRVWPDFYIHSAKAYGLILEDEFLSYEAPITRYEVIQIVGRVLDLSLVKTGNKGKLKDVAESHSEAILKLIKLGVVQGYADKTFRGEAQVTRAEAVVILKRMGEANQKLISQKNYVISERTDLSNYYSSTASGPMYEITENNQLKLYDNGRYAMLDGHLLSDERIDSGIVSRVIQRIITEDSYTLVSFIPSQYTINQLKVIHGESLDAIENGEFDFVLTYYENKPYELSRIAMEETFSNNCYLKIELLKMWRHYSEFKKGNYIDEFKKQKLLAALEIEFGKENAKKMLKYMIEKNEQYVSEKSKGERYVESKKFGNYLVNFYQRENDIPKFFVSKIK